MKLYTTYEEHLLSKIYIYVYISLYRYIYYIEINSSYCTTKIIVLAYPLIYI